MASQQELLDEIYTQFCNQVEVLKISADMPAVQVVGELTRTLKRVVVELGGTDYIENGVKYTKAQVEESE